MYGIVNIDAKHQQFIEQITKNEKVWGLMINNNWVSKSSIGSFFDDDGEQYSQKVVPFWMQKNLAEAALNEQWPEAQVIQLSLNDFLETVCLDLQSRNTLIGTNPNSKLVGTEASPLELIFDILDKLKLMNKPLFAEA